MSEKCKWAEREKGFEGMVVRTYCAHGVAHFDDRFASGQFGVDGMAQNMQLGFYVLYQTCMRTGNIKKV